MNTNASIIFIFIGSIIVIFSILKIRKAFLVKKYCKPITDCFKDGQRMKGRAFSESTKVLFSLDFANKDMVMRRRDPIVLKLAFYRNVIESIHHGNGAWNAFEGNVYINFKSPNKKTIKKAQVLHQFLREYDEHPEDAQALFADYVMSEASEVTICSATPYYWDQKSNVVNK